MVLVGPQVRHPTRLVRQTAKDTDVRLDPPAWDASADPGAVRLAADFPTRRQCPEAVRDSRPSALVDALETTAARPCLELPQLDALPMVVCLAHCAAQEFPLPAVAP
jgi:hypothetical protein